MTKSDWYRDEQIRTLFGPLSQRNQCHADQELFRKKLTPSRPMSKLGCWCGMHERKETP